MSNVQRLDCILPDTFPTRPPSFCTGKLDGTYPSETCGEFITCSNELPYVQKCPTGLEFDCDRNQCRFSSCNDVLHAENPCGTVRQSQPVTDLFSEYTTTSPTLSPTIITEVTQSQRITKVTTTPFI